MIYSNKFKIFGFFWTAILQKKIGRSPLVIKEYIEEYDVDALLSDNAELLLKFIPTETEVRVQRHLGHSGTVGIAYQLQLFGPFRQSSEKARKLRLLTGIVFCYRQFDLFSISLCYKVNSIICLTMSMLNSYEFFIYYIDLLCKWQFYFIIFFYILSLNICCVNLLNGDDDDQLNKIDQN